MVIEFLVGFLMGLWPISSILGVGVIFLFSDPLQRWFLLYGGDPQDDVSSATEDPQHPLRTVQRLFQPLCVNSLNSFCMLLLFCQLHVDRMCIDDYGCHLEL